LVEPLQAGKQKHTIRVYSLKVGTILVKSNSFTYASKTLTDKNLPNYIINT